jgi:hypothetical protein
LEGWGIRDLLRVRVSLLLFSFLSFSPWGQLCAPRGR